MLRLFGISIFKGLANVIMTLAFFYLCGWWLFVGWPEQTRREEDPIYAENVFKGLLPIETVLASRRYHPHGAEPWDCTYAIVRLAEPVSDTPPTRTVPEAEAWDLRFGGGWQKTPAPPLNVNHRDALDFCAKYWPNAVFVELKTVLNHAGAWFSRDRVGETLFLYSPKQRLAARIRFGD